MSADQPGLAAAADTPTTQVDGASGPPSSSKPSTHYPPAPGSRRARVSRFISDRLSPPAAMPASPPVLDGPPVTATPHREVDLPPAPPVRPLNESQQAAAAQVARGAEARVATAPPPRPDGSGFATATAVAATATATAAATMTGPVAAAPVAAPTTPTPVTPAAPRPVDRQPGEPKQPRRRQVKALPPGETGALLDEAKGRRLTRREQRQLGRLRARKVKRVVRHIEPWSVFKISLIFNVCLFLTFMVAGTLLWSLAVSAGTIDNVLDFLNDLIGGELAVNGETIFRAALYSGAVMVIANSLFMVLLVVLFNLISDLVGGIRVTVIEEENIRRAPVPTQAPARAAG
jgi:hypothetical protein